MEKTEYRIFPNKNHLTDEYLQFKRLDKKGREIWCYIPEELHATVIGTYLTAESCPTSLPAFREADFIHGFYGHENYSLIPFTEKYPNIDKYFVYLQNKRNEYLKDQEDKNNMKIRYL